MNERYTTDKKSGGKTRKSAASAKPKSTAAASVTTVKKSKAPATRAEKRAKDKAQRDKDYQAEQRYGTPQTKKYKTLRKLWIGGLCLSVISVALSYAASQVDFFPENSTMIFIGAAYVFIIATLYIDLGQIRKERKRWVAMNEASRSKESRAQQKAEARALRDAKKRAEEEKARKIAEGEDLTQGRSKLPFVQKLKSFFSTK